MIHVETYRILRDTGTVQTTCRHMLTYIHPWMTRVRLDPARSDTSMVFALLVQLTLDFGDVHAMEIRGIWTQLATYDLASYLYCFFFYFWLEYCFFSSFYHRVPFLLLCFVFFAFVVAVNIYISPLSLSPRSPAKFDGLVYVECRYDHNVPVVLSLLLDALLARHIHRADDPFFLVAKKIALYLSRSARRSTVLYVHCV